MGKTTILMAILQIISTTHVQAYQNLKLDLFHPSVRYEAMRGALRQGHSGKKRGSDTMRNTMYIEPFFPQERSLGALQPTVVELSDERGLLPIEERIEGLLKQMTLEEKLTLLGGTGFETQPIARLGIPSLKMTDGPLGVRWDKATAFPSGISMAATFNPALIRQVGQALGKETKALGRDLLLGPCVNIQRTPLGGRNFESFGEDPFLAATLASHYVQGLQSQKVAGSVKHFALNNQEDQRMSLNVIVQKRVMHEIYFPAFLAAVRSGVWSVMAAYNSVNGDFVTENPDLLERTLKGKWGFQGFVVSDWGATHSTVNAAKAGLDLEMPLAHYFSVPLLQKAIETHSLNIAIINDKVRRLLRAMVGIGLFDEKPTDRPPLSIVNSPEHQKLALKVAQESLVLLKNEKNTLPLRSENLKRIAVIGPNAAIARWGGGGSSRVIPFYAISPLEGLRQKLPSQVELVHAAGVRNPFDFQTIDSSVLAPIEEGKRFDGTVEKVPFSLSPIRESSSTDSHVQSPSLSSGSSKLVLFEQSPKFKVWQQPLYGWIGEYFGNPNLRGSPLVVRIDPKIDFDWSAQGPDPKILHDHYSVRWKAKLVPPVTGIYQMATYNDDGVRLYINHQLVINDWQNHATKVILRPFYFEAGKIYDIQFEYYQDAGFAVVRLGWLLPTGDEFQEAVDLAIRSDVALLMMGLNDQEESEGFDRATLDLPRRQADLIRAVAKVNKHTIVVLNSGSPLLMTGWIDEVPAILQAWYPGQEGGTAIADVILGRVIPSGKSPITFLKRWEDSPVFGHDLDQKSSVKYGEGLFVGYRHFDTFGVSPLFPFGHGLSYTIFKYYRLNISFKNTSIKNPNIQVKLEVQNAGKLPGAEIVQLYIHDEKPSVEKPFQELKGFQKIELQPGETKQVVFQLNQEAFAFYDEQTEQWKALPGAFTIRVGSSSRDIRLSQTIRLH